MVDLNNRYMAACMEINTRIGQRQNTLVIFVTLVFGIGAALTARKDGFDTTPLLFAIPVASLVCAALYLMHDLMIRNLVEFCRQCEPVNNTAALPGYYSDPCQTTAVKIRRLTDITAAVLIIGANVVAVVLAVKYHADLVQVNSLAAVMSAAVILASVVMVLWPVFTRK